MELTIVFEITDASLRMDAILYCSRRPMTAPILEIPILWSESSLSMWQDDLSMLKEWIHPPSDSDHCPHLAVINRPIEYDGSVIIPIISCRNLMSHAIGTRA